MKAIQQLKTNFKQNNNEIKDHLQNKKNIILKNNNNINNNLKRTLPSKILQENFLTMEQRQKEKINLSKPKINPKEIVLIDKKIKIKELAKKTNPEILNKKNNDSKKNIQIEQNNKNNNKFENKKIIQNFKPYSHYIIDKNLKFKNNNSDDEDDKNKTKKLNKNKLKQSHKIIKNNVNNFINEIENEDPNKLNKKSNSLDNNKPKKNEERKNFVKQNLKKNQINIKNRVHKFNIRKFKINKVKQIYKFHKNVLNNTLNATLKGKGENGLEDIETLKNDQDEIINNSKGNILNIIEEKVPIFSEAYFKENNLNEEEKKDITPTKNDNINNNKILTTALKSSLRKCAPLDTELKFLSKEFKYLLSDNKLKIEKLNQIKEENKLNKKIEFSQNKNINDNNNNNNNNNNQIELIPESVEEQITEEEIMKLENDILLKVLEENFNYKSFLPGQLECIKNILNNKYTICLMNKGKKLIYQLSSLVLEGLTIVISPLISSITNNLTNLPDFLPGASLTSFTTNIQRKEIFDAIKQEKIKILFITPERFIIENVNFLKELKINFIVIEQACFACPFNSINFRFTYIQLKNIINEIKPNSFLLLSNNIGKFYYEFLIDYFNIEKTINISCNLYDNNYINISKDENKFIALINLLKNQSFYKNNSSIVIFCNNVKMINKVAYYLNQNGFNASSYHSGKDELERQIIQNNFMKDKIKILVSTHAFSYCLTKKFIKLVVIFDIPYNLENFLNLLNKSLNKEVYTHVFLNDEDYFFKRKNIYAENIDRSKIYKFIEYIFNNKNFINNSDNNNNKNKIIKRSYKESINIEESNKNNNDNNKNIIFPQFICVNLNKIYQNFDIKKNLQFIFLYYISKNPLLNNNNNLFELKGIIPNFISIRFYKTLPNELAKIEKNINVIIKNSNIKNEVYTFNTIKVCLELNINYLNLLNYLYEMQNKKEISYETKDEGILLQINSIPKSYKNLINYINELLSNYINTLITKLNTSYILFRQFSTNNIDAFSNISINKNFQIKCFNIYDSYLDYNKEFKNKINNYFIDNNNENKYDIILAGNEEERNIILPIYEIDTQRELVNITKDIENLCKKEVQNNMMVTAIEIINILYGIFIKGKETKSFLSNPLYNKFYTYNYDKIYEICENCIKKVKSDNLDMKIDLNSKKKKII